MISKRLLAAMSIGLLVCGLNTSVWAAGTGKFSVQADELEYNMKTGEAVAVGHVIILQDNSKATGDSAQYNNKTRSGSLKGNVQAERDGDIVTCNEFVFQNNNDFSAIGNATVTKDGRKLFAQQINYSKASEYAETVGGQARLTDVDGSVVEAVKLIYDAKLGLVTATGGVNINSPARKLKAYADKAIYNTQKDGFVELIGNAEATQDGNIIKGDKLRLTNGNNVAVADGNVSVKYFPQQKQSSKKEDTEKNVAVAQPAIINKDAKAEA